MQIYLVGGAVRDQLLNYPCDEKDWVVVGGTPEKLSSQGFKAVGKDFPVFLHPETHEEYALARTERKTGPGYTGFDFHSSEDVTLEQDLIRRDLTINAMAQDDKGFIIDPHNGQEDLANKVLRHVSDAFREDPVRILRTARFAARYHHLGFRIAEETMALMKGMVQAGEADHLVSERVWKEMSRALGEKSPDIFIQTLRDCGALKVILPEVDQLFGVPQPEKHHPEIDTGLHTLMVLQQAALLSDSLPIRFAALTHDLGKGITKSIFWPSHHGHEKKGLPLVKNVCKRLNVPNDCRDLALVVCQYHLHSHKAFELKPQTLLQVMEQADAFRRPERFHDFLVACEADARGRTGFENRDYTQADFCRKALAACSEIDTKQLIEQGKTGKALGEALRRERLKAITKTKEHYV